MTYEEWKKQGEPYIGGLALLARLCPGHVLLPELQKGVTPLNKLYLKGSLVKAHAAFVIAEGNPQRPDVTPQVASGHDKKGDEPPSAVRRPPSADLEARLRLLMYEKAKLRNSYHDFGLRNDVPAVQARTKINRQLMDMRKEIEEVSRKLEIGKLGNWEIGEVAPVAIPEGDGDYREYKNLLSNVSRQRRLLRQAVERKDKEEIAKVELLLKQYETRRDLVLKKLSSKK